MKMDKVAVLLFLVRFLVSAVAAGPLNATYDQRQNGRFNLQINIKDVAIIVQSESVLNAGDVSSELIETGIHH